MTSYSVAIDIQDENDGHNNNNNTIKDTYNISTFGITINIGPYSDPESLAIKLLFFGSVLVMIAMIAPLFTPNPSSKASFYVSAAYVVGQLIVFWNGIGLVGLSYWLPPPPVCRVGIVKTAAPIPIHRARIAKYAMSKSFVPALLVVILGLIDCKLKKSHA